MQNNHIYISEVISDCCPSLYEGISDTEEVTQAMMVYAETYAKKCLQMAADRAQLSVNITGHKRGYPFLMVNQNPNRMEGEDYFVVDQASITETILPEHLLCHEL